MFAFWTMVRQKMSKCDHSEWSHVKMGKRMSLSWRIFCQRSHFQIQLGNCNAKFYHSFHAVFGRLARNVSCKLIVYLLSLKCMPILLYDQEACTINSSDIRTLQHPVNNAFMKIFSILNQMMLYISVRQPSGSTLCANKSICAR